MFQLFLVLMVLTLFMAGPALAQGDGGEPAAPFILPTNLILLGLVINRVVEAIKQALPPEDEEKATTFDRWRTPFILALSFTLGALAMLAVFPADNQFPSAATPAAGLIFTGILVGGFANGWDFLSGVGSAVKARIAPPAQQKAA